MNEKETPMRLMVGVGVPSYHLSQKQRFCCVHSSAWGRAWKVGRCCQVWGAGGLVPRYWGVLRGAWSAGCAGHEPLTARLSCRVVTVCEVADGLLRDRSEQNPERLSP